MKLKLHWQEIQAMQDASGSCSVILIILAYFCMFLLASLCWILLLSGRFEILAYGSGQWGTVRDSTLACRTAGRYLKFTASNVIKVLVVQNVSIAWADKFHPLWMLLWLKQCWSREAKQILVTTKQESTFHRGIPMINTSDYSNQQCNQRQPTF